jgi:hypothetical protein
LVRIIEEISSGFASTAGKSTSIEVNASAWKSQPATRQNSRLQCSVADQDEQWRLGFWRSRESILYTVWPL